MPRFSALTWRILGFNALALIVLTGGVILVQASGRGLVEERMNSIREQANIVAGTLSEYATDPTTHTLKVTEAEPLLRQLIAPTRLRGRLYLPGGQLAIDTRDLLARNVVQISELPPLDTASRVKEWLRRVYDGVMGVRPFAQLEPYYEAGDDGRVYGEVDTALTGATGTAERVDDRNRLVLSVAVPIQRFRAIYGVIFLSTEGGDIDDILRAERFTLFEVVLVAFLVMLFTSLYLAGTIAEPVRRLAAAADLVRSGAGGRSDIPNFPERSDEIGDLADSLRSMTANLYDRIDAIESFAADVAHELKNPLTSLASAMEMFSRAKDDESRARLLAIMRGDIKRIDRLITDISDASRLDAELSREAKEPVGLSKLLATIIEIYRMTDNPRGVEYVLRDDLPPGAIVRGRDERLGQVFRNLIDNAVSFSPEHGKVVITASSHGMVARVTVEDDGPGIPPDNLESIFERFYTERPGENFGRNSGLGLSIARQIIEGAGGRIYAENRAPRNRQGKGARLVVELPLAAPHA
ncbi:MAG TPA: stimulus-sensing domain-containing protein [Rhizomicrobium sp.]|jgi:two-component system sensor histidine kinase ChvG|nr:stimulus-sensing domain-containing protein [Rhizomicrobium sp.]